MQPRAKGHLSTVIGILAGVVAIATVVVFGYLSLETPLIPGPRGAPSRPRGAALKLVKPEHIVDNDYLFALTGPDSRWRVFDHAAADRGWADMNAAMLSDSGVAQVNIGRVGDITLDQAAAVVIGWRGSKPAASDVIKWLGRDAVELRFDYSKSSLYERLFLRDGYVYAYSIAPFIGRPALDDDERAKQWGAFTLIDGHVSPGSFTPPPRDGRGPTWRIENGWWESATVELMIDPLPGWRLLAGRELSWRGVTGDVLLANEAAGCYIKIVVDSVVDDAPVAKPSLHATVADKPLDLVEVASSEAFRTWKAQIDGGGVGVEIDAWGPAADGDRMQAKLQQGLATITRATSEQREAVAADLMAQPYHSTVVGKTWVDRNGTFVDYSTGLVWAHPVDGMWTVTPGPDAADASTVGASVAARDLQAGLAFSLATDPTIATTQPPAKWLKAHDAAKIKPIDLSGLHANIRTAAEGRWDGTPRDWTHQVGAFVDDAGAAVRVNIWGFRAALTAGQVELAKAIGGTVVVANATATRDDRGWYQDRRLGFSFALPGWTHDRNAADDDSTDQTWSRGNAMIGVLAEMRGGIDDPVTIARARNLASAGVAAGYDYPVHRIDTTIGGEPATRLTWDEGGEEIAVFLVEHHEIDYTLYSRGAGALGDLVHAFHFLENPVNGD